MKVSIIVPNYNGQSFIGNCLNSLRQQTYKDFEVILVDNCSTDGTVQYVSESFPEIIIEKLDKNYGFSRAVNVGVRRARGKFVVLLNSDTSATNDWLQNLLECIEQDERIFSCASKMIQLYDKDKIDDAGDNYSILGWAYQEGHGSSVHLYNDNRKIFSSCAGAAIYRKHVFEKIGFFDEAFFAYLEDVDVGYRALIEGYTNVYCADAKIYHIGSATSGGKYSDLKVKLSARNNIYVCYKNMPVVQLVLNLPFLFVGFILKYFFFWRLNMHRAYFKGVVEGVQTFHQIDKTNFKFMNTIRYLYIEYLLIKNTMKLFSHKISKRVSLKSYDTN